MSENKKYDNSLRVNDENPPAPLDICAETIECMLSLGTLNELVKHQPENTKYKAKQEQVELKLKEHLSNCQKCQDAFSEKPPE